MIVTILAVAPLLGLAQTSTWVDTYESRLEMLALTQSLSADILASTSTTHMANDPGYRARECVGPLTPGFVRNR